MIEGAETLTLADSLRCFVAFCLQSSRSGCDDHEMDRTSKLPIRLSQCGLLAVLLAGPTVSFCTADEAFSKELNGVRVELIGVSDSEDVRWSPKGKPAKGELEKWVPRVVTNRQVAPGNRPVCFLIKATFAVEGDLRIGASSYEGKSRSLGPAKFTKAPALPNTKYYQLRGEYPEDLKRATVEVLVSAGEWSEIVSVDAANSRGTGIAIASDAGRAANVIVKTTAFSNGVSRAAAASITLREGERIYDEYRLIGIDDSGEFVGNLGGLTSDGFTQLMLTHCAEDQLTPVKYVFEQRPRRAISFAEVRLTPKRRE